MSYTFVTDEVDSGVTDLSSLKDPTDKLKNGMIVYLVPQKDVKNNVSFNNTVKVEYVDKYIRDIHSSESESSLDLMINLD